MKKTILFFLVVLSLKVNAQVFTQTYVDKCTGEIKTVTTTPVGNGSVVVAFYNQTKTFTNTEVNNGTLQFWLNRVYSDYNSKPCPTSGVIQQTVAQAVSQQAASAAVSAAIPSTGNSGTTSSSTSPSTQSQNKDGNSNESVNESKNEETKSDGEKGDSNEEGGGEDSAGESSEENNDEEKNKKGGGRKKQNTNPTLIASDLALTQSADGRYAAMISTGISKSSMTGTESWGLTSLIWTTFDQFALNGGYTKMNFSRGKLVNIKTYSVTTAYLQGNFMIMKGHTYIKPDPKIGTYGYNMGVVNLLIKNENRYEYSVSTSFTGFWTKAYFVNRRLTLSPQFFISSSPISWNPSSGQTIVDRDFMFMSGLSYDYKFTRRFGLNFNYRFSGSTKDGSKILHNFMVGSRILL